MWPDPDELLVQVREITKLEALLIMMNHHISDDIDVVGRPSDPPDGEAGRGSGRYLAVDVRSGLYGLACEKLESDLAFYERIWESFHGAALACIGLLQHDWQDKERDIFIEVLEILRQSGASVGVGGASVGKDGAFEVENGRIGRDEPGYERYVHAMGRAIDVLVSTQGDLSDLMARVRTT